MAGPTLLQLTLVPYSGRNTSQRTSVACSLYIMALYDQ